MRKLVVAGVLLCAVITGCETKSPSGPSGLTPTTSTTTTTVPGPSPTTTTSTTTTTMVIGALARRYTTFQPPPNVPSEMTLFFELIQAPAVASFSAFTPGRNAVTENEYKVTGVYIMGNGTTGTVTGELGGSLNPLETGGDFKGSLTATMPSGCTALREFNGIITSQTLVLTGGAVGTTSNPCSPNPLTAFSSISMLRFDPSAPLPTPPSTTSSISTTTTTVACNYVLSPTSATAPSTGGTQNVNITAPAGCAWSAQSYVDWITVQPPYGGSGNAIVAYNVAATTTARTGTLLIAGIAFTVSQSGPTVDLVPVPPANVACATDISTQTQTWSVTVPVTNIGTAASGDSTTRAVFTDARGVPFPNADVSTGSVPPNKGSVPVTFQVPPGCFQYNVTNEICNFTITADVLNNVAETPLPGAEANNSAPGSCTRPFPGILAASRPGLRE